MDKIKYILIALFALLIAYQFYYLGVKSVKTTDNTIIKTDTISLVETRVDTVTINKPKPIYITKTNTIRDTLKTTDTIPQLVEVEIPIETREYKDSSYYAVVSGFKASLDTLKIYPVQTTITKEITQYKQKKWGIGLQTGFGYGVMNRKPDIYVGIGITYHLK